MTWPALLLALLSAAAPARPSAQTDPARGGGESPHGDLALDCNECHGQDGWVPLATHPRFRHDTTGFELDGAHVLARCTSCHQSLLLEQVGSACADCHADPHRGELGWQCERCHTPRTWDAQRDLRLVHERTRFPLAGAHARLECGACHGVGHFVGTPAECVACHQLDYDRTTHAEEGLSLRCEECHWTMTW